MLIYLIFGLIKTTWYKWVNIFLNRKLWGNVKVELDLSNYATKAYLKNFAKKIDVASLKLDVDE